MNWDAIGAVGEIAGAIAVVLSFIYLSTQIKASTEATDENAIPNVLDLTSNWLGRLGSDTEVASLFVKGMQNKEEMSDAERFQFSALCSEVAISWERMYYLNKRSGQDIQVFEAHTRTRRMMLGAPGFQAWFRERKLILSREFAEVLETSILESKEYSVASLRNSAEEPMPESETLQ